MSICFLKSAYKTTGQAIHLWLDEYRLIRDIWRGEFPELTTEQLPLTVLERSFMSFLVCIRSLSLVHVTSLLRTFISGSLLSEMYVVGWFAILILLLCEHEFIGPLWVMILVGYRLVDGLNYRLCIIFIDRYKIRWGLRSLNRSLILLAINYLEIVVGFASLYLVPFPINKFHFC